MSETEVPTTPGLPDPTLPVGDPVDAPDNPAEELEPGPVETPDDDDDDDAS